MSLPPIGFLPNQQRGFLRHNSLKNASNKLSMQPPDTLSLRFGGGNTKVHDYLKDLRANIEQATGDPQIVENLILPIRTQMGTSKGAWQALPDIRKKLEALATQQNVDFIEIQESHDLRPRAGWKKP